ncbi:hypothetical protein ACROYT_G029894 [Oculina patagonica]
MAPDSAKVVNKARELAITHILVGLLLVIFGIADRFTDSWKGDKYFGIWIGVWMCITGGLGIPGSRKERSKHRKSFGQVTGDAGYVMTQGPSGVPVAIPMQACSGAVAVQTVISGAQGVQQQIILLPVSGPDGFQVDIPPPYEEEEKMT